MSSRRYAPLEDYGLVGDGRSAALVGRDGSVDWWCPPRFDAPSVFARLLDDRIGGFCSLAPAGAVHASPMWESSQRYCPGTCVLVTEFRAADARLEVTDLMPWPGPEAGGGDRGGAAGYDRTGGTGAFDGGGPPTRPTLLRRVEARGGPVEAELRFAPRLDCARTVPEYRVTESGWTAAGPDGARLGLTSDAGRDLGLDVDGRRDEVTGRFRVVPGEPRWVALRWGAGEPGSVSAETCRRVLDETAERWRRRAREVPAPAGPRNRDGVPQGRNEGDAGHGGERSLAERAGEAVVRSALTLDLLTHLPTGGVVGAATTSLPGAGPLRDGRTLPRTPADATAVLAALAGLDRKRAARRLCRRLAEAGPGGRLRGDVGSAPARADGEEGHAGDGGDTGAAATEVELEHLHGYEGSRPVRALPFGPSGSGGRADSGPAARGGDGDAAGPALGDRGDGADEPRLLARRLERARDLALEGRPEEAVEVYEAAAGRAGPTGLLAEAVDPEDGRLRGNLPSAAAHAALVDAARVIAAASRGELRTTRRRSP